jgi:DNA topoisomerase-1
MRIEPEPRCCDPPSVADIGLVYISDLEPGIRRLRAGTGFSYRLPNGRGVDKDTRQRIRKLAIPPAWTEVWICPLETGHIQATGRDARGRKQYIYHPDWRRVRDEHKFDTLIAFAKALPRIRAQVDRDMRRRGRDRKRVLATVVHLLDRTLIRVGNDEYAKANGSFGLTTLRSRHVRLAGDALLFHFKGKSGKIWKLQIRDRRIARVLRTLQDLPGQNLFQFEDEDGEVRSLTSNAVNAYIRELAGPSASAKYFRTWGGTVLAAMALGALGPFATQTEAKVKVKRGIDAVAEKLGNTPSICRKCYVHPVIVETYLGAGLPVIEAGPAPARGLPREEKQVLQLLESAARAVRKARKRPKLARVA